MWESNAKDSHIFPTKNNSVFENLVYIYLTSWRLNNFVRLTILSTIGHRRQSNLLVILSPVQILVRWAFSGPLVLCIFFLKLLCCHLRMQISHRIRYQLHVYSLQKQTLLKKNVSWKGHFWYGGVHRLSVNLFAPVSVHVTQIKNIFEPRCEKTGILHMRKQRRRSASR